MKTVRINGMNLPAKEVKGQRVVTFKEINKVHERPDNAAERNFYANKKHFIEGVDFYRVRLTNSEIRRAYGTGPKVHQIIALTESGYLMLVKSFTDKLAWEVQRQLVNTYFKVRTEQAEKKLPEPKKDERANIPVNEEAQRCIAELRKMCIALEVSLNMYNRYIFLDDVEKHIYMIKVICADIFSVACDFKKVKIEGVRKF
jgi:hypothetical protein